jgi:hypothetical protein
MINEKNESNAAGKAQQNGGQLAVVSITAAAAAAAATAACAWRITLPCCCQYVATHRTFVCLACGSKGLGRAAYGV